MSVCLCVCVWGEGVWGEGVWGEGVFICDLVVLWLSDAAPVSLCVWCREL